jgi:hypothetical protein
VTFLTLNAPGARVTYDLGVGADSVIRLTSFGSSLGVAVTTGAIPVSSPSDLLFPALLIAGTMVIVVPLSVWQLRPRRISADGVRGL